MHGLKIVPDRVVTEVKPPRHVVTWQDDAPALRRLDETLDRIALLDGGSTSNFVALSWNIRDSLSPQAAIHDAIDRLSSLRRR